VAENSAGSIAQVDLRQYYLPRWANQFPSSFVDDRISGGIWTLNSMTLSLIGLFIIVDQLAPALEISISVSAASLDSRVIPMPAKFSTSLAGTPWGLVFLFVFW